MDKKWIVLYKKHSKSLNKKVLRQKGPFDDSEVRWLLEHGKIQYQDYVWTKGYKKWKKISEVEIFRYKLSTEKEKSESKRKNQVIPFDTEVPSTPNTVESKELLKLSELNAESESREVRPEEVEPQDLVKLFQSKKWLGQTQENLPPIPQSERRKVVKTKAGETLSSMPKRQRTPTLVPKKKFSFFHLWSAWKDFIQLFRPSLRDVKRVIVLTLVVFLISLGFLYYNPDKWLDLAALKLDKMTNESKPSRQLEAKKKREPINVEKKEIMKEFPKKMEIKKPEVMKPTYVRWKYELKEGKAFLVVFSDAARPFPITLELEGKMGEILNQRSFYFKGPLPGDEKGTDIDLDRLGLTEGSYSFRLQVDQIERKGHLFYGKRNLNFNKNLYFYKKSLARFHQQEKRNLFFALNQLRSQLGKWSESQGSTKKRYYLKALNSWNRFVKSEKYKRNSFFPDIWENLHEERKSFLELNQPESYYIQLIEKNQFQLFQSHFWSRR